MAKSASIRISSELHNLSEIRRFVRETANTLGINAGLLPDMLLAVDEAATNIMMYGYRDKIGDITVEVRRDEDDLIVCLRDNAPVFDLTTVAPPDLDSPLDDRQPGGMGIWLIGQMVDKVSHRTLPGGGNELILIKYGRKHG